MIFPEQPIAMQSLEKASAKEVANKLSEIAADGLTSDEDKAATIGAILMKLNCNVIPHVFLNLHDDMALLNICTIIAMGYSRTYSN